MLPLASLIFILFFTAAMVKYGVLLVTPAYLVQDILRTMPDFLIVTDPQEKVVLVNQNYLNQFGFSANEVVGRKFIDLREHNHANEHEEVESRLVKNGIFKGEQMRLIKKSGERVPVEISASLVRDQYGDEIGRLYICRDISEERRLLQQQNETIAELTKTKERMLSILEDTTAARDEIKKLYEDLKVVDRMKTEFLSVISHELRTPLTPIKGYSSLLLSEQIGKLTPDQARVVAIIQREGVQLLGLIDSILDITRMTYGRGLMLEKEPTSIRFILADLQAVMQPQWDAREIKFKIDLSEDFPALVGDPGKIRHLLTNLLGNALKFTPKGGYVKVAGFKEDGTVQLQVVDNGIGIAKENLEKVFEKFFQVDSSYTRAEWVWG
jgi:PAS domain S-box-containing protein